MKQLIMRIKSYPGITLIIIFIAITFLKFTQNTPISPEPLFDWWSIIHFGGFLGWYLFLKPLYRNEKWLIIALTMCTCIIEIAEYLIDPVFWEGSIGNNGIDILCGIQGLAVGFMIAHSDH